MNGFQFQEDGDKRSPVLLLANSLGASNAMWDAQVRIWQERFRVLRFNYAGHGTHGVPVAFTAASDLAAFVLNAIEDLGVRKFHFVGLSMGGMLGLQMAAQAPERLDHLVLASCRYYQAEAGQAMWNERIRQVRESGVDSLIEGTLERWFTEDFRTRHPDAIKEVARMMQSVSANGYAAAATLVRDFDARPLLGKVSSRALVISGAQDSAAPPEHMQALAHRLKADYIDLHPCAHLSNIERAGIFSAAVNGFLGGRTHKPEAAA